jgi:hypothetical protein
MHALRFVKPTRMRRSLAVSCTAGLLLAATLTGVASAAGSPTAVKATSAPASGQLYVDGNLLKNANGSRFVLKAASVNFLEEYDDSYMDQTAAVDWQYHDQILSKMQSMGINSIRVPMDSDMYINSEIRSQAAWQQRYRDIVAAATAHGIRVFFVWFDPLSERANFPSEYQNAAPAMKALVDAVGVNNPMVEYEPWNEPNNIDNAQWLQVEKMTVAYWRVILGYTGPLYIDTAGWSWNFDPAQAQTLMNYDASLRKGKPNLVFANHQYANGSPTFAGTNQTNWNKTILANVNKFPIVGTEYGNANNSAPQYTWDAQFLTYVAKVAVPLGFNGATAFTWDWVDGNTMVTADGNGKSASDVTTLNQWGNAFQTDFLNNVSGY